MTIKSELISRMRKCIDRQLVDVALSRYLPSSEIYSADPEEHAHFPLGRFMRRSLWQKDGRGEFNLVGRLVWGCFGLNSEYGVMEVGPNDRIVIERQGSVASWILNGEVIGRVYYSTWFKWLKFATSIPFSLGTSAAATGVLKTPLFISAEKKAIAYGIITIDALEGLRISFKVRTIADEFRTRNESDIENIWHSESHFQMAKPHGQACPIIGQSLIDQLDANHLLFLHGIAIWSRVFYVPFGGTNRNPIPGVNDVQNLSNKNGIGTR